MKNKSRLLAGGLAVSWPDSPAGARTSPGGAKRPEAAETVAYVPWTTGRQCERVNICRSLWVCPGHAGEDWYRTAPGRKQPPERKRDPGAATWDELMNGLLEQEEAGCRR